MLYNTGTIAINGNTATGTGTNWTAPASQVRAGQTIIVMSNPVQMFQISSVNSATTMTVTPAASPALSGQKYGILLSDNISVDGLAQAMSQLIKEYDENIGAWETFATTSANQSITVTINGTPVTIPGIGKLAQKGSNGSLAITDGGTGATKAEDARTNLGLGTAATSNTLTNVIDQSAGALVRNRDFGIGGNAGAGEGVPIGSYGNNANYMALNGWYGGAGVNATNHFDGFSPLLTMCRFAGGYIGQIQITNSGKMGVRGGTGATVSNQGTWTPWYEVYSTGNTTKASDGTLKAASPVARIVASQETCQRADIAEDGFSWCGCGTANVEAEGITISRLDIGVYVLAGSAGLASEGWQLLPPMDPCGMGELGVVESERTGNGELTIRLFKRKYMLSEDGEIIKTKGELMDVPANSWIDVRLDMPENSAWNQRQREAMETGENDFAV
ncbi:TPA: phage tail protein [Enterobacter kobei]|uniref:phage tail fiber protein n=1 Tax=Enterobacter cloacae complex TaxID=354276 RepID=UPI00200509AD|nr:MULTISPECIES: phage tail protein [Enterobacter cloacae complex]DAZ83006.1 MAG TPA: tail protein [Caudoviricetes sp.]ELE9689963.1 phage tail protein [Enterobacter kobei]MCK6893379.1 phage tail protein [Enterobacter kobei]WGC22857.1 phage tail protein [Enterobacter ludwigii]HCM9572911.1 phage tail protein [Enterobacter kobei]